MLRVRSLYLWVSRKPKSFETEVSWKHSKGLGLKSCFPVSQTVDTDRLSEPEFYAAYQAPRRPVSVTAGSGSLRLISSCETLAETAGGCFEKFGRSKPFSYCYERSDYRLGNIASAHTITDLRASLGSPIALILKAVGVANDLRCTLSHNCRNEMIPHRCRSVRPAVCEFNGLVQRSVDNVLNLRAESTGLSTVIFAVGQ